MFRVNVEGTDNVLRAAHLAGVPRTVYLSSAWALGPTGGDGGDELGADRGRPLSAHAESKVLAHVWR